MKKVIDFLTGVRANNNRDWFEAHRDEYREALGEFNALAEKLMQGIAAFDPGVSGLTLKDTTYRIYRDVRFSANKDPYKTHMGVYICPGGKKSGYAGYYFHVEPAGDGLPGGSLMTAGLYMPEGKVLKSMREEIDDNGEAIVAAIKKAKGFALDQQSKLKRLPAGFVPGGKYDELLKQKDLYIVKPITNEELLAPDLAEKTIKSLATTKELVDILNKAVKYAYEEM